MTTAREQEVLDVTFHSTPQSFNAGWGWRIPHNPDREPGKCTELEQEVMRLAKDKTPQQRQASRTVTYTYEAPIQL